ncbi:hypothetical protein PISMIDRAFT_17585 [Pisolithus microcarpus 441]|uniref:Uncharacterized protein n=1 Tax=Pisolithus microcarpus 441 TaxID=765257 RepID=A0A0C9Z207_9AGAM|nr:hypothetical protein BKA83DRAFT_17585 [Pisolithus microcarpus]KIK14023.1 hypothetical protein PISMIDRAFT_17585 [Pisolithus microcarpus 441]
MDALDVDFVELQVGGGGRAKASLPPILTPTHLRTAIKAMNRDGDLISKAQAHHTQQTISSAPVTEIPGPTPGDDPFITSPDIRCTSELFQDMENVASFHRVQGGSTEGDGNMHTELNAGACDSPTPPRLLPPDYEKRGLVEPSNTTGTDPDTGSCDSPTPKGKLLGHEQRGLKECGYAGVDTGMVDCSRSSLLFYDSTYSPGSHDSPTPKEKPLGDEQRG